MGDHLIYLRRTFQLASYGVGNVHVNPLVGWLICHDHKITYEGWLLKDRAIDNLFKGIESIPATGSTLYLNIDPIAFMKKPDHLFEIIAIAGIQHMVLPFGSTALSKHADKYHINLLTVDTLAEEAKALNIRFYTYLEKGRPYLLLKWAQTADGFVARQNYDSKWISSAHARKLVHQWRAQEQAIMVGTNTCLYDDPKLNVRNWCGPDPVRIVLDRHLRLPSSLHVFDGTQPTLCYNTIKDNQQPNLQYIAVAAKGYKNFVRYILNDLAERGITSVLIEGGSQLLALLIANQWWDEARVFQVEQHFGKGIAAPSIAVHLLHKMTQVADDQLLYYQNTNRK